jgi:hypothetical protein
MLGESTCRRSGVRIVGELVVILPHKKVVCGLTCRMIPKDTMLGGP